MCCFVQELFSSRICLLHLPDEAFLEAILDEVFKPGDHQDWIAKGFPIEKAGDKL
jgi:hypothetical protein